MNKRLLTLGITLIVIVTILNIGISKVFELKEPVFLKNYVEKDMFIGEDSFLGNNLELKYIANETDDRLVSWIEIVGYPEIQVSLNENMNNGWMFNSFNSGDVNYKSDTCGRYVVNTIRLALNFIDLNKKVEEIEINKVKVGFNDGSSLYADLGRIKIYEADNLQDAIRHISTSHSSNGQAKSVGQLRSDIELVEVKSDFAKKFSKYIDLKIDGVDYRNIKGMTYKKGHGMEFNSIFKQVEEIDDKYTFIDIRPKLCYKDGSGKISNKRIINSRYKPQNFNFIDIYRYLKSRGEI